MIKCWIAHAIGWILYWEWKTKYLSGDSMVVNVLTVNTHDNEADRELLLVAQHHQQGWRVSTQIASLGRDHNSKSELLFLLNAYWFVVVGFFFLHCSAFRVLVPRARIEPVLPAVELWGLNHWTAKEVLHVAFELSRSWKITKLNQHK